MIEQNNPLAWQMLCEVVGAASLETKKARARMRLASDICFAECEVAAKNIEIRARVVALTTVQNGTL